jgi:hypothetical protein
VGGSNPNQLIWATHTYHHTKVNKYTEKKEMVTVITT